MDAYSLDLRNRVLAASDERLETREELSERFGVSVSFITKLLARRRDGLPVAAKPHSGGFASAVDAKASRVLGALVKEQPDATLEELRRRLGERCGVSVSVPVVWRAVTRLGLPLKKSRSTPPNGTRRGCGPCAGPTPAN